MSFWAPPRQSLPDRCFCILPRTSCLVLGGFLSFSFLPFPSLTTILRRGFCFFGSHAASVGINHLLCFCFSSLAPLSSFTLLVGRNTRARHLGEEREAPPSRYRCLCGLNRQLNGRFSSPMVNNFLDIDILTPSAHHVEQQHQGRRPIPASEPDRNRIGRQAYR